MEIKRAPLLWLWGFLLLQILGTLNWSDVHQVSWDLGLMLNGWAVVGLLLFWHIRPTVSRVWWSLCGVYLAVWLGSHMLDALLLNEAALRYGISSLVLLWGIYWSLKVKAPLQKMWLVSLTGILFVQVLHASLFALSFNETKQLWVKEAIALVESSAQKEEWVKECQARKVFCQEVSESAPLNVILPLTNPYTKPLHHEINKFVIEFNHSAKRNEVYRWSIWDAWRVKKLHAVPYVIAKKTEHHTRILIDAHHLWENAIKNRQYFTLMVNLGGLTWVMGGALLIWFHARAWNRRKLK